MPFGPGRAESAGIGGNPGTFPGFEAGGLKGRLGMQKPSPINMGVPRSGGCRGRFGRASYGLARMICRDRSRPGKDHPVGNG